MSSTSSDQTMAGSASNSNEASATSSSTLNQNTASGSSSGSNLPLPIRPSLTATSSTTRRSFLGKLNPTQKLKKAIPTPRRIRFRKRDDLFQPTNDVPLGLLIVRVLAAKDLIAKDRNGFSDPYPSLRYGTTRINGPTVHKSLNPTWGLNGGEAAKKGAEDVGGEAKLETLVYECRGLARERIEIVLWDKDRLGREYMGEVNLGIDDWWGSLHDGDGRKPPIAIDDEGNKPIWHPIRSSRSRAHVSGSILVQVGFAPAPPTSQVANALRQAAASTAGIKASRSLSNQERERIFDILQRCKEEREASTKAERVLLTSPTEGVGTQMISDSAPLGMVPAHLHHHIAPSEGEEDHDLSDSDTASTMTDLTTDATESDYEDAGSVDDATSTEDDGDELHTAVEAPANYFSLGPDMGAPLVKTISPESGAAPSLSTPPIDSIPAIVVEKKDDRDSNAEGSISTSTSTAGPSRPAASRRGLSLPGFMKRRDSSKSVISVHDDQSASPAPTSEAGTDRETSSAAPALQEKRKRFTRRKTSTKDSTPSSGTSTPSLGAVGGGGVTADGLAMSSLSIGGDEEEKKKRKRIRRLRRKQRQAATGEEGDIDGDVEGIGRSRKGRKGSKGLGRRRTKRDYTYEEADDILGLVQIEVQSAKGLPRYKNLLKVGYDMDPFVVCSFGRKVFRTRVIRHSLDPKWDERLAFNVRQAETQWTIAFSIYDWDKISSNDHVGDVTVPLEQLLGATIQPGENGLFPSSPDGRLLGDDFYEHSLNIETNSKELAERHLVAKHPTLQIRAKFTPYAALRQQFWRLFSKNFINDSNSVTHLEIISMLDSLGSTLTKDTIASFFTRFGKTPEDDLTMDEVVMCLEQEVSKPKEERRIVDGPTPSRPTTPRIESFGSTGLPNEHVSLSFAPPTEPAAVSSDPSSNMKPLAPGAEVVTNEEKGTTVKVTQPRRGISTPSRQHSMASSEDSSARLGAPLSNRPTSIMSTSPRVERVINIRECPLCQKPRMNSKAELDIITHLGICSSTDPHSVNRMIVAEYVTASQAQRKWLSKAISRATKGAYQLGADSANIIVLDRQTGNLLEEKIAIYVRLGMRLAYRGLGAGGGMEGAKIARLLDSMSRKQGVKYDSPSSVRDIQPFIDFHNLNLNEILDPVSSFKTFNEFFYRKLKPGARPVAEPSNPAIIVSPADCRAMFFDTVQAATSIWIKGREFTIARLLGEHYADRAHLFENASLAIFRLAPQDYHRFHSPVDGTMGPQHDIPGRLYTVNPIAIRSHIDVYGENKRVVYSTYSETFGEVVQVAVAAMLVGSWELTAKEGDKIKRGDEVGYFAFGGSTIVCLFNDIQFDEDLITNSKNSIETLVRMGMRIGRKI